MKNQWIQTPGNQHTKYGFLYLKVVYNRSKDQFFCLNTELYWSQFFFFKISEEDGGAQNASQIIDWNLLLLPPTAIQTENRRGNYFLRGILYPIHLVYYEDRYQ